MKIPYISINANVFEYPATEFEGNYQTVFEPFIHSEIRLHNLLPIINSLVHSWDEATWRSSSKMQYLVDCFLIELMDKEILFDNGGCSIDFCKLVYMVMRGELLQEVHPSIITECLVDKDGELVSAVRNESADFIESVEKWAKNKVFSAAVEKYHNELVLRVAKL